MKNTGQFVCLLLAIAATAPAAAIDGSAVYAARCATCHESGAPRTPARAVLESLDTGRIVQALETGAMRLIGTFEMSGPERVAVAEFLTGKPYDPQWRGDDTRRCAPDGWPADAPFARPHWNGWGVDRANTRFQPAAMAGIDLDGVRRLELRWAFAFPGETFTESQPSVVGGRLFVGSPSGAVYALDAASGCTHWVFQADAAVKAPVTIGALGSDRYAAFFGDQGGQVYALDAATGTLLWKDRGDDHPSARITGGIQVFEDRVYVPMSSLEEGLAMKPDYVCCVFRGSVIAYDAASGERRWKSHLIEQEPAVASRTTTGRPMLGPSGAAVWSAVTIDEALRRLYVGTGDNYSTPASATSDAVVALDLDTGKLLWSYQGLPGDAWNIGCMSDPKVNCPENEGPDQDMGGAPILTRLPGGKRVLIGAQKSGYAHALDPDDQGRLRWKRKLAQGGVQGGLQWGQATDGRVLYAAISDLRWRSKEVVVADALVDPASGGGLVAVDLTTGDILWQAPPVVCGDRPRCSPAQTAAVTAIPGVVFSGSQSGQMRAFDARTGDVIWSYDTVREFDTVNGARGHGGSIDQAGVVVAGGMVYFNSGYSKWGAYPGNVVLAFAPAPAKTASH